MTRKDASSKAISVSGKDGWIIESKLAYDIPQLKEKGDTVFIVVVKTSDKVSSLYLATVPESQTKLVAEARERSEQLRVEPA